MKPKEQRKKTDNPNITGLKGHFFILDKYCQRSLGTLAETTNKMDAALGLVKLGKITEPHKLVTFEVNNTHCPVK